MRSTSARVVVNGSSSPVGYGWQLGVDQLVSVTGGMLWIYGTGGTSNADLFYSLRAVAFGANALVNGVPAVNTRQIVFISPPDVKNPANPSLGIGTTTGAGQYYDPWGTPYLVEIDGNYDNQIANPYTANAGATNLQIGVIAWSLGKDKAGATAAASGDKKTGTYNDDVISWQ